MVLVPLAWLGDHVALPAGLTAELLAADLVRVGLEEEAIHTGGEVSGPLVVGHVLSRAPEPQKNGKTINWCQVDVGEDSPRGIVCGAHNFEPGDHVVVALPGAVLPGDFAIAARKTYGHVSDGMICSARELGIGEDHSGIIVLSRLGLSDDQTPAGLDAKPLLGIGEQVLEVNVTPDRGYCFAIRGIAREYSHATGAAFDDPGAATSDDLAPATGGFPVEVDDEPLEGVPGCDRFVALTVRGVRATEPSPAWMQRRLTQAGMRPLNLAVDVTNYVMLDLGQPLHAYDLGGAAGLAGPIVVRRARAGERLETLDGVDRALDPEDLVVTDSPAGRGSRIIGLAGVMGGEASGVNDATTAVVIEAAHFDPITVARTSRRHKLSSEAAKRFERGVDPQLPRVAARHVAELLIRYGGGEIDAAVTDIDRTVPAPAIAFDPELPARLVGVPYTPDEVRATLAELGCAVADDFTVTAPSWRPDLRVGVDLVEEVARLRGYHAIPSVVPAAPPGRGLTRSQRLRRAIAERLVSEGLVQVLSYPFVGAAQWDAMGIAADDERRAAVRVANPISESQPFLRTDLLVSVLDTARRNVARGNPEVSIFESGLVVHPVPGAPAAPQLPGGARPSDEQLAAIAAAIPHQPRHVAGLLASGRDRAGWWGPGRAADHTDAFALVRSVAEVAGVAVTLVADAAAPFHPGRCAKVVGPHGETLGHAGELHPSVVAAHDLPARAVAFELDLDGLFAATDGEPVQARPVSTFPVAKEDVALVVDATIPAGDVLEAVRAGVVGSPVGDVLEDARLFDVYTGEQVGPGRKSLAFSLRLRATDRTLTAAETAAVRESVVAEATRRFGATLRG
ncbi:MAG TPA: phenylalanine--tRNA ligase subunit beta [Cellulomonas sp.]